jgi:hypothetical protein
MNLDVAALQRHRVTLVSHGGVISSPLRTTGASYRHLYEPRGGDHVPQTNHQRTRRKRNHKRTRRKRRAYAMSQIPTCPKGQAWRAVDWRLLVDEPWRRDVTTSPRHVGEPRGRHIVTYTNHGGVISSPIRTTGRRPRTPNEPPTYPP